MFRLAAIVIAALVVFSGVKPSSAADTRDIAFASKPMDSWIVTVKGNVLSSSKWTGSDQMSVIGYPSMSVRRANAKPVFSSPDDGISFDLLTMNGLSLAPVFKYRGGRYSGSHRELTGIHDTKWTVEGGLAATFRLADTFRARAEIRRGFRDKDGFEAAFGVDFIQNFNNWQVAIGPRLVLADNKYMRHHFGVTALDATRNTKVTEYRPDGGVKTVGLYASATYKFNETWSTTVHGGYDRLVSNAADSPIVKSLGSANQYTIGLTIAYSFPVKW